MDSGSSAGKVEVVEKLLTIWSEALGRNDLSEGDNFFELGGDSIQAMIAIAAINADLGIDVPLELVFEAETIGEMNNRIIGLRGLRPDLPPEDQTA